MTGHSKYCTGNFYSSKEEKVYLEYLGVEGKARFSGDLSAFDVIIGKSLQIDGEYVNERYCDVKTHLCVGKSVKSGSILSIGGYASIGKNFKIPKGSTVYVGGYLHVFGDLVVEGGELIVLGDVFVDGKFEIRGGKVDFRKALSVKSDFITSDFLGRVGGNLKVNNDFNFKGDLYVFGNITVLGKFFQDGVFNLDGSMNIS